MNVTTKKNIVRASALVLLAALAAAPLAAQGKQADYDRAVKLKEKNLALVRDVVSRVDWIDGTPRFWYVKSMNGGSVMMVADAEKLTKAPAFDHAKLAAALNKAVPGGKFEAGKLPLERARLVDKGAAVELMAGDVRWRYDIAADSLKKAEGPGQMGPMIGMGRLGAEPPELPRRPKISPDGMWDAFVKGSNLFIRTTDKAGRKEEKQLSWDGTASDCYVEDSLVWSPDSKRIAVYKRRPAPPHVVHYVESSPADQVQPKHYEMEYAKPGDAVDIDQPVMFNAAGGTPVRVDNALFPNPYDLGRLEWRKDGRAFTFDYNQRGHQVYRVIEVDSATGRARTVVDEQSPTFFCYSGKMFRQDLGDGAEIVWMSERDGWNHLYLYNGRTGAVKNRITGGEWVVRGVDKVDEAGRRVFFHAGGMNPGEDPYFVHYYSINLDGTGLTALDEPGANNSVFISPDMKYYVDIRSRVDLAPVCELRSMADRKVLMEVEKADISALVKSGWRAPEVFKAKGRDGKTDIWGLVYKPSNFDKNRKYPVIEYIYAGPQDSFVPKSFILSSQMQYTAELGFVVASIDGMGTSNRSKAFHDVCWKNLADAGFPDRILWHKAYAASHPWYDISRVGIYGGSAGGQNSLAGMLFHPEFYKVCVSACGCHDNRMDKMWWNEQWMGWPIGPEYSASSNVDNAWRLQGKLLLVVGELDTNVDPASTMQVVNALVKANKSFEMLVLPGMDHGLGGPFGDRTRNDFFVRYLMGVEPPDWNRMEKGK